MKKLLLVSLLCPLIAQTPLFNVSQAASCTSTFTAPLVSLTCFYRGATVFSTPIQFNPHLIEGSGNGLVISINGLSVLYKKTLSTDPLTYQVSDGSSMLASGSVTIP